MTGSNESDIIFSKVKLNRQNLENMAPQRGLTVPDEKVFELPEKVLQFGTGVLLRGLPDYFIDKANREGVFNGRIVVVKSTSTGSTDIFGQQDGLYTLCIKGIEDGKKIEETIINSSISRVLSANDEWNEILKCAYNSELQIIISNTTEVGIALTEDNIHLTPPLSFPGKLLAFLYERYKAFNGSDESGMVVIPTELITDNGTKLYSIVVELAKRNQLEDSFIGWLQTSNHFCNSLVDRIVPGALSKQNKTDAEKKFGYTDELMIMSESFRLWAIESNNKKITDILSFHKTDKGVVIADDIEKFRELKLRLLNGTHSFTCALAVLAGFKTVKEAMNDKTMSSFVQGLMQHEIVPAISNGIICQEEAIDFTNKVLDRFRNPFVEHLWSSISVQYSSKMKMRNIPVLLKYYNKTNQLPEYMALGFASYLLFMKCSKNQKGEYIFHENGTEFPIHDNDAHYFEKKWANSDVDTFVNAIFQDKNYWGADLSMLKGFSDLIKRNLKSLIQSGAMAAIKSLQANKITVP